jgi:hypothetical protein
MFDALSSFIDYILSPAKETPKESDTKSGDECTEFHNTGPYHSGLMQDHFSQNPLDQLKNK